MTSDISRSMECEIEDDEEIDYQDKVDEYIFKSVKRFSDFPDVLAGVKDLVIVKEKKTALYSNEVLYIGKKYVDFCMSEFIADVDSFLLENNANTYKNRLELQDFLAKVQQTKDLKTPLIDMKFLPLLNQCLKHGLLDNVEEIHLITRFKYTCWNRLVCNSKDILIGENFISELKKCLRLCFCNETCPFDINSSMLDNGNITRHILDYLISTDEELYKPLKRVASKLETTKALSDDTFTKSVHDAIDQYLSKHVTKQIENRIEVNGFYLTLAAIKKEIIQNDDIEEVRICAKDLLLVNTNLVWPGKNVVFIAQEIYVSSPTCLDVSGLDGKNLYSDKKARNGTLDGNDGCHGVHGQNGESGGNVLICSNRIRNMNNLKVISNGGNGSDGQDGGDGKNGKDGQDGFGLTQEQFIDRFPDTAKFIGDTASENKRKNLENFANISYEFNQRYYEGQLQEGNEVTFSCYQVGILGALSPFVGYPFRQSYCLIKGTNGSPGTKGGDGGSGGNAGFGGYAGYISVRGINGSKEFQEIYKETKRGENGKKGKDGKSGNGGRCGLKGIDHAKIEPAPMRCTRYSYGNLKLSYTDRSSSENAWCTKNKKYAEIDTLSADTVKYAKAGKVKSNTSDQKTLSDQILRKKPIIFTEILKQYKADSLSNMDNYSKLDVNKEAVTALSKMADAFLSSEKSDNKLNNREKAKLILPHNLHRISSTHSMECLLRYNPSKRKFSEREIHNTVVQIFGEKMKTFESVDEKKSIKLILLEDLHKDLKRVFICKTDCITILDCIHHIKPKIKFLACDVVRREINQYLNKMSLTMISKYKFGILNDISEHIDICIKDWYPKRSGQLDLLVQTIFNEFLHECITEIRSIQNRKKLDDFIQEKKIEVNKQLEKLAKLNETDEECKLALFSFGKTNQRSSSPVHVEEDKTTNGFDDNEDDDVADDDAGVGAAADDSDANSFDDNEDDDDANGFDYNEDDDDDANGFDDNEDEDDDNDDDDVKGFDDNEDDDDVADDDAGLGADADDDNDDDSRLTRGQNSDECEKMKTMSVDEANTDKKIDDNVKHAQHILGDINNVQGFDKCEMAREELGNGIDKNIQELILQLKNLKSNDVNQLIELLFERLEVEGLQISFELLYWFIACMLHNNETYVVQDFLILFGTQPQETWLVNYVLLQLKSEYIRMTYLQYTQLRQEIIRFKNIDFLFLLSQKLALRAEKCNLTKETITAILQFSEHIETNNELECHLPCIDIRDWPSLLEWFVLLIDMDSLPINKSWEEADKREAAYCMSQIKKRNGTEISNKFMNAVSKQKNICTSKFLAVLRSICVEHMELDDKIMHIIEREQFEQWNDSLARMATECRCLDTLIHLTLDDSNGDINKTIQQIIKESTKMKNAQTKYLPDGKLIKEFKDKDIQDWCKKFGQTINHRNLSETMLGELIAVIDQAVFLTKGYWLRDNQKISICLFLCRDDCGNLQQLATGEGKSLIIVIVSIIKALMGFNVDVITSTSVLAKRDAYLHKDMYAMFNVQVGHNCSQITENRKKSYTKNCVVYGDVETFQRDILMQEFYDEENGLCSRKRGYAIVDEVDSMLLDQGQNVLYLSHSIAGIESIEPVFVYIWTFVHGKAMLGTPEDIDSVEDGIYNVMYATLRKSELEEILTEHIKIPKVWNQLIEHRIINIKGRLLIKEELMSNKLDLSKIDTLCTEEKQKLLCHFKDTFRKGVLIDVPIYFQSFIDTHLRSWIASAFKAKEMKLNDNYIIDIDRTETAHTRTANVVIMEKSTGMEQYQSKWSDGLHQFLQMKHGCKLSSEQLKAVFISNVSFFKIYGTRLYGLTGTLGTEMDRKLLNSLYNVHQTIVPSFCRSKFVEKTSKLCKSKDEWRKTICKKSQNIQRARRPVLIICESVKDVETLQQDFTKDDNVSVFKRSYESISIGTNTELNEACIILATNLAGRGTDIKISEELNRLGGLFVILTFLPPNTRIEEQGFGRAARKGQYGSGQIIFFNDDEQNQNSSIIYLKTKRDMEENDRNTIVINHYEKSIMVEERQFSLFQKVYHNLKRSLSKHKEELCTVILLSCLDEWALLLDEASHQSQYPTDACQLYFSKMKTAADDFLSIVHNPSRRIQLAKVFAADKQYEKALKIFNEVIAYDDRHAEAAHYYICLCLVRKEHDKEDIRKHLEQTEKIVRSKCDVIASLSSMVSVIHEKYKVSGDSFLIGDDYTRQNLDIVGIYNTFLESIKDVIGQNVSRKMLESTSTSPEEAQHIFQLLLKNGTLTRAIVHENWQCCDIENEYKIFFKEIYTCLQSNLKSYITAKSLKDILPNREEFWEILKKAKFITKERRYFLLDKTKVESNSTLANVLDLETHENQEIVCSGRNEGSTSEEICLFPELLDDIRNGKLTMIPESELVGFSKMFKKTGFLKSFKTGTLHYDVSTHLCKYDELNKYAFTEIAGITESMSEEIFGEVNKQINKINPSDIWGIQISSYKEFKTEILNVIVKHHSYRLALCELLENPQFIDLPSKPHILLFEDLIEKLAIRPIMVNPKLDEENIKANLKEMPITKDETKQYFENMATSLYTWKDGLSKYYEIDFSCRDISEYFDSKTISKSSEEINNFMNKGLSQILILGERKWTFKCKANIAAIALIGLAQIAIGVSIEVISGGAATHIAAGLIEEGVSDIIFATECAFSGYCTWSKYASHKVASISITVITGGVGVLFSRGAQFSRFGYKIGGDYLKHMCWKELATQVGKKTLLKQCGVRVMKKVIEAGAIGVVNGSLDLCQSYILNGLLEKIPIKNKIESIVDQSSLKDLLTELYDHMGEETANITIANISRQCLSSRNFDDINSKLASIGNGIAAGIGNAAKKTQSSGKLAQCALWLTRVIEVITTAENIAVIVVYVKFYISEMEKKIKKKIEKMHGPKSTDNTNEEKFREKVLYKLKIELYEDVKERLSNTLVMPFLKRLAHSGVRKIGKFAQKLHEDIENYHHEQKFNKIKKTPERTELVKLMRKCRDPMLFARIIREGVPADITCVQAAAEVLKIPIEITTIGGDGTIQMPERFTPAVVHNDTPLRLNFITEENKKVGHFCNPSAPLEHVSPERFDCLFDAIGKQDIINREQIAKAIETNPDLQKRIRLGFHDHFIGKGGLGGVKRSKNTTQEMSKFINNLRTKNKLPKKKIEYMKRKCRDRAGISKGGVKPTGNDELFRTSCLTLWREREGKVRALNGCNMLDLFIEIRVDTRYVLFVHDDGSLQGHSGALFSENRCNLTDMMTKGQSAFHDARTQVALKCNTTRNAAINTILHHANSIIHPNELKKMAFKKDCFTSTRHNMKIEEQKMEFCRGLERERYKLFLVAKKLSLHKNEIKMPSKPINDEYIQCIEKQLDKKKAIDIKLIGEILREPAPYCIEALSKKDLEINFD